MRIYDEYHNVYHQTIDSIKRVLTYIFASKNEICKYFYKISLFVLVYESVNIEKKKIDRNCNYLEYYICQTKFFFLPYSIVLNFLK